ncbi:hypothetical protein ACR6HW_16510 [Fusibacter sp. JL298sf-3]
MKKKMVIELLVYIVAVVIGIIMLFTYEPKEVEIVIPSDFQVEQSGGANDAFVPIE